MKSLALAVILAPGCEAHRGQFQLSFQVLETVMKVKNLKSMLLMWFPLLLYERLLLDTQRPHLRMDLSL